MKLRMALAALLSLVALAAFAQNPTPAAPLFPPSQSFDPTLTADQRIARLEQQVSMLQTQVQQLEDATKMKARPLIDNSR